MTEMERKVQNQMSNDIDKLNIKVEEYGNYIMQLKDGLGILSEAVEEMVLMHRSNLGINETLDYVKDEIIELALNSLNDKQVGLDQIITIFDFDYNEGMIIEGSIPKSNNLVFRNYFNNVNYSYNRLINNIKKRINNTDIELLADKDIIITFEDNDVIIKFV